MKINLHTHSNYSLDGSFNVIELIEVLKREGFDIIAITDHNTCEAYKRISNIKDIKIITGLEADAIINDHTYDFLCYNFDLENVYEYASSKYKTVEERQNIIFNRLIELCKKQGILLSDVESYKASEEYAHAAIYRMLNTDFLTKYKIKNVSDLYRLSTIDKNFPLYVDMHIVWPDIKELIDIIHNNNGKVFLAHPFRYNKPVIEVLEEAKDFVDGIEICNNPKDSSEVKFLYDYAKNNNLLISCGSDYHGNDRYIIKCEFLTNEMIQDIVAWIK